jgi:hypothetical protein
MPGFKLTDTQLVLLSAAAQRDDRGVELPPNPKRGVARKSATKLVEAGLVEEVRARGTLPVWRRDEGKGAMALRITRRGLTAIRVEDGLSKDEAESRASSGRAARRSREGVVRAKGDRAGRGSRRSAVTGSNRELRETPADRAKKQGQGTFRKSAANAHPTPCSPLRTRADSTQASVIAMLQRPDGAAIAAIMDATGWQQHSVRGLFAGVMRKKLCLTLTSDKTEAGRTYRIVAADAPNQPAVTSEHAA